ncbi:DUF3631 domain-containing protein [Streptomyces sp. CA-278952]|uniref:DUF3631 domain-containing protein n=1 Tax=Streptomyces sp. CA-278952 TaxID=2980556 RepID=UPI0023675520|nr:DUF3631 domain-containing protein [Streptomyces sp. CA-278952]WDG29705.1 DUF3631 domain-containing protein [Streptomyces sp. CA-278952]
MNTHLLNAALNAAERGWHVFPLRPADKRPALHGEVACPGTGVCVAGHRKWEQRATNDPDRIRKAWSAGAFIVGLAAPLLSVADAAGGGWPERARTACVELVNAARADDKGSLGIRLLTDLRDHVMAGIDRMPTVAILDRLCALDEAPWADMSGRPLDSRGLAKMLGEYMTEDNTPVKARNIKTAGTVLKGYYAADLHDAWQRYCPPPPSGAATSATSATAQVSDPETVAATLFPSAT